MPSDYTKWDQDHDLIMLTMTLSCLEYNMHQQSHKHVLVYFFLMNERGIAWHRISIGAKHLN